jgi:hypothetical protein
VTGWRDVVILRNRTAHEEIRADPVTAKMPARTHTKEQAAIRSVLGFNVSGDPGFELESPRRREEKAERPTGAERAAISQRGLSCDVHSHSTSDECAILGWRLAVQDTC